jgi:hypothetical protein
LGSEAQGRCIFVLLIEKFRRRVIDIQAKRGGNGGTLGGVCVIDACGCFIWADGAAVGCSLFREYGLSDVGILAWRERFCRRVVVGPVGFRAGNSG